MSRERPGRIYRGDLRGWLKKPGRTTASVTGHAYKHRIAVEPQVQPGIDRCRVHSRYICVRIRTAYSHVEAPHHSRNPTSTSIQGIQSGAGSLAALPHRFDPPLQTSSVDTVVPRGSARPNDESTNGKVRFRVGLPYNHKSGRGEPNMFPELEAPTNGTCTSLLRRSPYHASTSCRTGVRSRLPSRRPYCPLVLVRTFLIRMNVVETRDVPHAVWQSWRDCSSARLAVMLNSLSPSGCTLMNEFGWRARPRSQVT